MKLLFLVPCALMAGALWNASSGPAAVDGSAGDPDAEAALALLAERCWSCHGAEEQESLLRLDQRESAVRARSRRNPAIVPGQSGESELLRRALAEGEERMPPEGEALGEEELALLTRWIDAGAAWPERLPRAPRMESGGAGVREADVRALLSERCHGCHGASRQRSGLRLDQRESALAPAFSGMAAIVPGAPEDSELLRRVRAEGDERMPATGDPLRPEEILLLEAWIADGAPWPSGMGERHWAYVAPVRPTPPAVSDEAWVRNAIDRFVLARLEREGVAPSPEAERATLLRRVSLDLIGLPPTEEELARFLADDEAGAFERQVDRLLASPHFGERWGRHWLDLARYSDSNGYSRDFPRSIWPYRDWVVDALNRDMPFDRFTLEQMAGDLLPNPTREQRVATGFHRNTLVQNEGGADDEEFRIEAVKNRVETTSTVWLGSTMVCAQCHDHKYDPFEQREYYELFAFFNQTEDRGRSTSPRLELPTPEEAARIEALDGRIAELRLELLTMTPELREAQAAWIGDYQGEGDWTLLRPERASSPTSLAFEVLDDDSVRVSGELPESAVYSVLAPSPIARITGLRLEVLMDPERLQGPGLGDAGNFALTELVLRVDRAGEGELEERAFGRVSTSFEHKDGLGAYAVDGDPATGWAIKSRTGLSHQITLSLAEPLALGEGDRLSLDLEQELGAGFLMGRFRLAVTGSEDVPRAAPLPQELVQAILGKPAEDRTPEEAGQLDLLFLAVTEVLDPVRAELDSLLEERPQPATTLVLREASVPRRSFLLERGSFLAPAEEVEPDVPDFLLPLDDRGGEGAATRVDLARWLVDPENPLTARVQVNRWWQRLFGAGLVLTENDFGTRGDRPSHPALLDWLAVQLVEDGWSLKQSLRRMVLSATYRQSSAWRPELAGIDPGNRLLARQSRLRLEGEVLRDSALVASGLLERRLGGPPVYPPQPAFDSVLAAKKEWPESEGVDRYRRTLYTWHWRNSPYPFVETFDGPGSNEACTRRSSSNTPLQALVMANDPMIHELAQGFAERVLRSGATSEEERIRQAFRWSLARDPREGEVEVARTFLSAERRRLESSAEDAERLAPASLPEPVSRVEGAAWTALSRVLFNLDEFLTRG